MKLNEKPGLLLVMSAPSGAGKSTLTRRLLDEVGDCVLSVSATTRAPRAGEVDGVHYHFITHESFEARVRDGEFIEHARVHANYYGTPRANVTEQVRAGKVVLLDIDVQGAAQVRERWPDPVLVFVAPPSVEVLEARLRGRGTESEEQIALRLANAHTEMARMGEFDYVIVNDDLDAAYRELLSVIAAARARTSRRRA